MGDWQLCWSSGQQYDLLEVGVPLYRGLAIPWYVYGSDNLIGRHGCVTFQRSVCSCSPASLVWTPNILLRE
jgi:hypothetical protein